MVQSCIQDTLSSRAALGLPAVQPLGRVRRASKGILHTRFKEPTEGFNRNVCPQCLHRWSSLPCRALEAMGCIVGQNDPWL